MRAIAIAHFGDQPFFTDISPPEPGPGQVEIRIVAASMNPLDMAVAAGYLANVGTYGFPLILGFDASGFITRIGAGVDDYAVGDRVYGQLWDTPQTYGSLAESAVVATRPALGALAHAPTTIDLADAAALPTSGMTALGALESCGASAGETVLVLGASGGVGTLVTQAARARGIRVIGSASAAAESTLRGLGADHVVTRDPSGIGAEIRSVAPGGVNAVIDCSGSQPLVSVSVVHLADGGIVLSTARGIDDDLRADSRVHAVNYSLERKHDRIRDLTALVEDGAVRPVIGARVDFADVIDHLNSEHPDPVGARGKTLVLISEQSSS